MSRKRNHLHLGGSAFIIENLCTQLLNEKENLEMAILGRIGILLMTGGLDNMTIQTRGSGQKTTSETRLMTICVFIDLFPWFSFSFFTFGIDGLLWLGGIEPLTASPTQPNPLG